MWGWTKIVRRAIFDAAKIAYIAPIIAYIAIVTILACRFGLANNYIRKRPSSYHFRRVCLLLHHIHLFGGFVFLLHHIHLFGEFVFYFLIFISSFRRVCLLFFHIHLFGEFVCYLLISIFSESLFVTSSETHTPQRGAWGGGPPVGGFGGDTPNRCFTALMQAISRCVVLATL